MCIMYYISDWLLFLIAFDSFSKGKGDSGPGAQVSLQASSVEGGSLEKGRPNYHKQHPWSLLSSCLCPTPYSDIKGTARGKSSRGRFNSNKYLRLISLEALALMRLTPLARLRRA